LSVGRVITRRRFLYGLGAVAAGAAVYANRIEPHRVSIVDRDLPVPGLPADLDGKRLIQLSDLHIGPTDEHYLLDCFRRVGELGPELIVITGDFMTSEGTREVEHVARLLAQLPRPPLGSFGSFGNHDYGPTWANSAIADGLAPAIKEAGVRLLRNELVDVAGVQLVGMDEIWARKFRPREALAEYDHRRASIALSHNPDTVDDAGWRGYRGWILSGHTHGGQCSVPFLGPPFLPIRNTRYARGDVDLGDGRRLYVNRGLGYHWRIRFNVRPEMTAFTLRRVDRLA
jgi:predicted MPP superfamily phosphohydrolase